MTDSIPSDALVDWYNRAADEVGVDQQFFQNAFMVGGEVINPNNLDGAVLASRIEGQARVLESFRDFVLGLGLDLVLVEDDLPDDEA